MKTSKRFFKLVRLLTSVVILSVASFTSIAVSPDNKIPDEKKDKENKENFIRSEVLPCLLDSIDVKTCVEQRIRYPERAIAQHIEGDVVIEFTVDAQGNVCNPCIIKDIGACCGLAALTVVRNMKFKPAVQNGYTVPCTMRIPVRFRLIG
jgi:TonB family protein